MTRGSAAAVELGPHRGPCHRAVQRLCHPPRPRRGHGHGGGGPGRLCIGAFPPRTAPPPCWRRWTPATCPPPAPMTGQQLAQAALQDKKRRGEPDHAGGAQCHRLLLTATPSRWKSSGPSSGQAWGRNDGTALSCPRPLAGTLPAIASKSDAHRLLICAALADGPDPGGPAEPFPGYRSTPWAA